MSDWVADILGVVLGIICGLIYRRLRPHRVRFGNLGLRLGCTRTTPKAFLAAPAPRRGSAGTGALAALFDEQLAQLLQAEIDELHVKGIRRLVAHPLWHAIQCERASSAQRVCDPLGGVAPRCASRFCREPCGIALGDGQPQRRLPGVLGVGFPRTSPLLFRMVLNHRVTILGRRRIQPVFLAFYDDMALPSAVVGPVARRAKASALRDRDDVDRRSARPSGTET